MHEYNAAHRFSYTESKTVQSVNILCQLWPTIHVCIRRPVHKLQTTFSYGFLQEPIRKCYNVFLDNHRAIYLSSKISKCYATASRLHNIASLPWYTVRRAYTIPHYAHYIQTSTIHCILHKHINRHIMFISTQKERAPNSVIHLTVRYIKFADQNALSRVVHTNQYLTVLCVHLRTSKNCYKLLNFLRLWMRDLFLQGSLSGHGNIFVYHD